MFWISKNALLSSILVPWWTFAPNMAKILLPIAWVYDKGGFSISTTMAVSESKWWSLTTLLHRESVCIDREWKSRGLMKQRSSDTESGVEMKEGGFGEERYRIERESTASDPNCFILSSVFQSSDFRSRSSYSNIFLLVVFPSFDRRVEAPRDRFCQVLSALHNELKVNSYFNWHGSISHTLSKM